MSPESAPPRPFAYVWGRIGDWIADVGRITMLVVETLRTLLPGLRSLRLVVDQMYIIGVQSLLLVFIVSLFTGAVAAESEGLMQDYKVGWMIGSTPRILTYMQLMAVPVGALALAWIYPRLIETYGLGGENGLSSPTSQRWVGFAKVVTHEMGGGAVTPAAALRIAWMKSSFAWGAIFIPPP